MFEHRKLFSQYYRKSSLNREGLLVTFEFFIGYTLGIANDSNTRIQELWEIYLNFGDDYNTFLANLVLAEVRDVMGEYEAFDLFQERETIGNTMFSSIQEIFLEYNFNLLFPIILISFLYFYIEFSIYSI